MAKHYLTLEIELEANDVFTKPQEALIEALRDIANVMEQSKAPALNCRNEKGQLALWMDWRLNPEFILKQAREREEYHNNIQRMFAGEIIASN